MKLCLKYSRLFFLDTVYICIYLWLTTTNYLAITVCTAIFYLYHCYRIAWDRLKELSGGGSSRSERNETLMIEYIYLFIGMHNVKSCLSVQKVTSSEHSAVPILGLHLISYIQCGNGTDTTLHWTYFSSGPFFYARQHICYSAYMPRQFRLSVRLSVRPSVRPSVRLSHACIDTAERIIEILSPSDRPNILVFRHQRSLRISDGFTPNGGAKYKGVAKK